MVEVNLLSFFFWFILLIYNEDVCLNLLFFINFFVFLIVLLKLFVLYIVSIGESFLWVKVFFILIDFILFIKILVFIGILKFVSFVIV